MHDAILKQRQCLIAFLYLGIALTSSANHREELERAAELAVEKAAERAAERAVEKALDSGNVTTESKLVRESYSNVQKENPRKEKQKEEDYSEYAPVDDEVQPEEDADDWSTYIRGSRFTSEKLPSGSFRAWSSKFDFRDISDIWKRYPRSEWSHEDTSADEPGEKDVTEKSVSAEKRIPYSVYKHVPYEVKMPQFYTLEKRIPVKIYLNVPELYQIERQVPYEVKIGNPASYRVEVPISRPYAVDKPVVYEVKAPVDLPHPIEKKAPVALKVAVDRPVSYPQRIKVEKPYAVDRSVPMTVKVLNSRPYIVEKPVQVVKPSSVPVRVDKLYEVQQARPVLVPVRKSVPVQAPISANLDRKDRGNASRDKEAVTESESAEDKRW
jgi:hypothetical protein